MIYAAHMTIGPVRFVLRNTDGAPIHYTNWAYRDFVSQDQADGKNPVDAEIVVDVHQQSKPVPAKAPDFEGGRNWAAWEDGDGWIICSGIHDRSTARAWMRVDRMLTHAELYVEEASHDAPLRYPLDQILMWGLLGQCGGFMMHAAGVARENAAWLLAGRSGAGKSTLSALCAEAGWDVWNDDRMAVYPSARGWCVAGTPWHGSGCHAAGRSGLLDGVAWLVQSEQNVMEAIEPDKATRSLLNVVSIPLFDPAWSEASLNALSAFVTAVPIQAFHFTRSMAAVEMLNAEQVAA